MFDNLQSGVILINPRQDLVEFTNALSQGILHEVLTVSDLVQNINAETGKQNKTAPIERQVFYLFESTGSDGRKRQRRRKTEGSSQAGTSSVSMGSLGQDCFSLKEIAAMSYQQLNTMIFTFDKNITVKVLTDDAVGAKQTKIEQRIKEVLRALKSMHGIPEEFVPSFRFFQFKKSTSFGSSLGDGYSSSAKSADSKVLLTMNDISQKILSDNTRNESDLISLVNTTATSEMMEPLQTMLN
jgi:hypothetical protein